MENRIDFDLKQIPEYTVDYINSAIRQNKFVKKSDLQTVHKTVKASTAPLCTIIKGGPEHLTTRCLCGHSDLHISFFEAMTLDREVRYEVDDFCHNRNTFITGRLPQWLTGLDNKKEFSELPSVYNLYHVLSRGTYWWKEFSGQKFLKMNLSREARLLLFAATGKDLKDFLFLDTRALLKLKCNKSALGRIKNWFMTLDGLLISILLGSQGHTEICNWGFFDRIMQTYLKTAISDLFKVNVEDITYYARLKEARGWMKDKFLKERKTMTKNSSGDYLSGNFWYFNKIIDLLELDAERLTPDGLKSIAYLTQTRAAGLPPKPVELKAIKDLLENLGDLPKSLNRAQSYNLSRGVDSICRQLKSQKNYKNLLNTANLHTKISLSNSASFTDTREEGGKVESARKLIDEIPDKCPYFDLETGKVLFTFSKDDENLSPGTKMFHYSILVALTDFIKIDDSLPHIGDVRISSVAEPGKYRIITISRIEHAAILHPLAHLLKEILASLPSSRTGMTASNHMWDTYVRLTKDYIPRDGIYDGKSTFVGSEDWKNATDCENPYAVGVMIDGLRVGLDLPNFYVNLCKRLLTMPRRIFDKSILTTKLYNKPIGVKVRGILQGDPLTKQMLHMSHLVPRQVGLNRLRLIGLQSIVLPLKEDHNSLYGGVPFIHPKLLEKLTYEEKIDEYQRFLTRSRFDNPQDKNPVNSEVPSGVHLSHLKFMIGHLKAQ